MRQTIKLVFVVQVGGTPSEEKVVPAVLSRWPSAPVAGRGHVC
jgi:hypothetical protein